MIGKKYVANKNGKVKLKFSLEEIKAHQDFLSTSELFQNANSEKDELYNFYRNNPGRLFLLKKIEEMWRRFKGFSGDKNFVRQFSDEFLQRYWEIFLANSFINAEFELQKAPANGPDIKVKYKDKILWIEAISVGCGITEDFVPETVLNVVSHVPENQILLRLTSGFRTKLMKFEGYRQSGVVGENDLLVIAIDLSGLDLASLADEMDMNPLAAKGFYGIGDLTWSVPIHPNKGDVITFFPERKSIPRTQKDPIPANAMLDGNFRHISAVITNVRNIIETTDDPKSLKIFIHKDCGDLEPKMFTFCRQFYCVENDHLVKKL